MDFLHRLEKCRIRETLWWRSSFLFDFSFSITEDIPFCDRRKDGGFLILFIRVFFVPTIDFFPAHIQDRFSCPDKLLVYTRDNDPRCFIQMDRIKLCEICLGHKKIQFPLIV